MNAPIASNDRNIVLCTIPEVEQLKQCSTIRGLLNELQKILQKELEEHPDSETAAEFKTNLKTLEKEYQEEIPKVVDDYQKEYPSWVREKLPKAEEQYKKLLNWSDDIDNPGREFREAINKLRDEFYNHVEACLKSEWDCAREQFKYCQCCCDRSLELKDRTKEEFENHKKFKETVTNWFKELDDIYKEAEIRLEAEKYKALYAYRLEFNSILHEVKKLKKKEIKKTEHNSIVVKNREWFKDVLTQLLRNYCLASYEYFYWKNNWSKLSKNERQAFQNYQDFKQNRRSEFVREAQDVELPDEPRGCHEEP